MICPGRNDGVPLEMERVKWKREKADLVYWIIIIQVTVVVTVVW
jgi:hypothetical protein